MVAWGYIGICVGRCGLGLVRGVVGNMMGYFSNLCAAMRLVSEHPQSLFMGQAVACEGTAMFRTLADVHQEKRLELPVVEDMQMGMAIGMSLNGHLPICIYPRFNFLLLALNQLVLHLDKLPLMGGYKPKVLIRTAVATSKPLYPGPQHIGNYSLAHMLDTVVVDRLECADDIVPAYEKALGRERSTLLIEYHEKYDG
jgi:pyruvate/2-oxoglutarate/acetoin dehydrogenase E1 component